MLEPLITIKGAIELSGLSRTTLWRLEKAGKIESVIWNGRKMFFRADVDPMADRRASK